MQGPKPGVRPRGQSDLKEIAERRDLGYWSGVTWVYRVVVTNGAGGGAGELNVNIVPGEGSEMEVLYGQIINGDTVARAVAYRVDESLGGDFVFFGIIINANAGTSIQYPVDEVPGADTGIKPQRLIVSGEMSLLLRVLNVAASQDATFTCIARVRGDKPTVTLSGNSDFTFVTGTDRFF